MEKREKLYQQLSEIQCKLVATKNEYNSFGKYPYRNAESILANVKPYLKEYGLTVILQDEIVLIGDRFYIKATATLGDGCNSIVSTAYAREDESKKGMDCSQVTGATSSYARKYALCGLFAIDGEKDADALNTNADYASKPKASNQTQVEPQVSKRTIAALDEAKLILSECQSSAQVTALWASCTAEVKSNKAFTSMVAEKGSKFKEQGL